MGYLVLARKWRPQHFDELTGQDAIVRILKNAILQKRIAHAYLFSGPRGVGKTTTARILAKALNCEKGPTPSPCNTCTNCKAVIEGHSVDMMEIDGASNNSVDDIRDLRERVKFAPSTGRYKIYIIDEAHMLSQSAFNALLKTLEEPPGHVVFVLATTAPHKIPLTVQSRCQHLAFSRIPSSMIKAHLKKIVSEEGFSITDGALDMIVRAADGSMRDALTLLDQIMSFSDSVNEEDVRTLLGLTDRGLILELLGLLFSADRRGLFEIMEKIHDTGVDYRSLVHDMIDIIRNMLLCKITSRFPPEITEQERMFIKEKLPVLTEEEIHFCLQELLKTEDELKNAYSSRIVFEMGLLRVAMFRNFQTVQEAIRRLQRFVEKVPQEDTPAEGTTEETIHTHQADCTEGTTEDLPWDVVISRLEETSPALASRIVHSVPVIHGHKLKLQFNGGHSIHADAVRKNLGRIIQIVSEITGGRIKEVEVENVKTGIRAPATNGLSNEEKLILDTFGGRIIERRRLNV